MPEIIRFEPDSIEIPEGVAAGRLGFKGKHRIPDEFRELYRGSIESIRNTAEPMALIGEFPLHSDPLRIGDMEIPGELANKHLGGSETATVILATIGQGIDEIIMKEEKEGNTLASFFLDGLASEFVEFTVRKLDSDLRMEHPDRSGGARISPGYGDIPLELNGWIVDLLGGSEIGISCLEESFQLVPRKTVSAFIGWRDRNEE